MTDFMHAGMTDFMHAGMTDFMHAGMTDFMHAGMTDFMHVGMTAEGFANPPIRLNFQSSSFHPSPFTLHLSFPTLQSV